MRRVPETAAKPDWPRKVSKSIDDIIAEIQVLRAGIGTGGGGAGFDMGDSGPSGGAAFDMGNSQ